MHENECVDVATGGAIKPCAKRKVLLSPEELAQSLGRQRALHRTSLIFLASNAKPEEVATLRASLGSTPLVQFDRVALLDAGVLDGVAASAVEAYGPPELAVVDTLICALAEAFVGTRRSMFSWNILEERIVQGQDPGTGRLM